MPTKNPRLTITLTPALHARFRRMSELTGNSQSALIADLLESSTPVFDRLIAVLSAAEEAKAAMKGTLAADMQAAQTRIEAQMGLVLEEFDAFTAPLLHEVEAVKRRARRGRANAGGSPASAASRSQTPPSNRGVRSPTTPTKTTQKTTPTRRRTP